MAIEARDVKLQMMVARDRGRRGLGGGDGGGMRDCDGGETVK